MLKLQYFVFLILCIKFGYLADQSRIKSKPNIIIIMADDTGWNDVSFHGSNETPTPNIDALAYGGIILNRHYVLPTCTPSRSAFLTGRHPVRMGLQGYPLNLAEPRGIPLHEKLLPEYLQQLGYVTRLIGKWHVGYYSEMHTPTRRGFDSFIGYYGGYVGYFNHTANMMKHTGIDFHLDTPQMLEKYNNTQYFTDFVTDQAVDIIKKHNKQKPLYLQISHLAGHASDNVDPIEVHNMTEVNETLGYIPNLKRRKYAGIIQSMDESVGKVVKALSDTKMLGNSIIIFMSDNGAPTAKQPFKNHGSNYPLRGMKGSVFEGAVRVPTCIFSPLIEKRSRVSNELIHITDWLPTLYNVAGGDPDSIKNIDGIDQWTTINGNGISNRKSTLINIDEIFGREAAIVNNYKLIRGKHAYFGYYGENGNEYSPSYNVSKVLSSLVWEAIKKLPKHVFCDENDIKKLREKASISCETKLEYSQCFNTCLFDILNDPCETTDISDKNPGMVTTINHYIDEYRSVLMNQTNTYIEPSGYPENFNGYWMPWMDHEHIPPKDRNKSAIWSEEIFCSGYEIDDPRNCL